MRTGEAKLPPSGTEGDKRQALGGRWRWHVEAWAWPPKGESEDAINGRHTAAGGVPVEVGMKTLMGKSGNMNPFGVDGCGS